ncbi:hypothetical protein [Methanobrevibacter sp.]|uniref:hypothetical protein n=1 Tax=Methanobrevibacter sp. TaxID=66852 RepID=UPI003890DE01
MKLRNVRFIIYLIIDIFSSVFSLDSFKIFLKDQKGALVLPIAGVAIDDKDWIKYKSLKCNKYIESITLKDLSCDFSEEACLLVDEFRRKTVDEMVEWMIYFDYHTGEVIYCWEGEEGRCLGDMEVTNFMGRNVASIHSHSRNYYSFPSPENFDILENKFEDYEIVTSVNAIWTVEFKGEVCRSIREDFQNNLSAKIRDITLNSITD